MKPDVAVVMQGFFATLLMDIAPNLNAEYSVGNASIMGLSLFVAAEEFERAAEVRVRENEEMRALFAEGATVVADKEFAGRLLDASKSKEGSLRISALNETNDALAKLLIELQVALESGKGAAVNALDGKVWDYLVAAAERRKFNLPSFG
ncbi:MAG TPA: hypothetical protein VF449_04600 [Parvibaculum sp.]